MVMLNMAMLMFLYPLKKNKKSGSTKVVSKYQCVFMCGCGGFVINKMRQNFISRNHEEIKEKSPNILKSKGSQKHRTLNLNFPRGKTVQAESGLEQTPREHMPQQIFHICISNFTFYSITICF